MRSTGLAEEVLASGTLQELLENFYGGKILNILPSYLFLQASFW